MQTIFAQNSAWQQRGEEQFCQPKITAQMGKANYRCSSEMLSDGSVGFRRQRWETNIGKVLLERRFGLGKLLIKTTSVIDEILK